MTREEAIKQVEVLLRRWDLIDAGIYNLIMRDKDAIKIALAALRSVTKEQIEKVWRGEWIGDNGEKVETIDGSPVKSVTCSACGNWLVGSDEYSCGGYFCPDCGRAMTDEAVQMVMERLGELYEKAD